MCTVSWLYQDNGYQLFCNRDEKKTRALARGPELIESRGVRYIAPVDRAGGGTWIAVNEHALSLCLLNGPGGRLDGRPARSRGYIIMELAVATSIAQACDRARQTSLVEFDPFRLVLLEPLRSAVVITWDGVSRSIAPYDGVLLSSSSVDDTGAQRAREQEFVRLAGSSGAPPETHVAFHRSHGERASAYSPCMHRPDAETVSFTCVHVTSSEVLLHYSPASPCRLIPAQVRQLSIAS